MRPGRMAALAWWPTCLEFGYVAGLSAAIDNRLKTLGGDQGWSDSQTVMTFIMSNLADGECIGEIYTAKRRRVRSHAR
jgi:hypothetical protein